MEEGKNQKQSVFPQKENSKRPYPPLDRSIVDFQERNKIVHQICNTVPSEQLTPYYLEQLTKYLTETPKNKKEKQVLTTNRLVTINKRQMSYEGLVAKLENG